MNLYDQDRDNLTLSNNSSVETKSSETNHVANNQNLNSNSEYTKIMVERYRKIVD